MATAHEIRALAGAGYRIGLCQVKAPVLRKRRGLHPQIRDCIDQKHATLVAPQAREAIEAPLAVFHNPLAFTAPMAGPRLKVDAAIVVAHQGAEDTNGVPYYDPATVDAVCADLAGTAVAWAPISPNVRQSLDRATGIRVHDADWHNTIFPEEWHARRPRPLREIPVVGRHSRADKEKWPATRADILRVYPADPAVEVRLLGVGDFLTRTMGAFPDNWRTFRFGEVEPAQFLKGIDFFVYYHHPHWIEAFGRTVAEALASGAVAILPPHFESTFDGAAIYARDEEAIDVARSLHGDWGRYRSQSAHAARWVKENYGPERHVRFVRDLGAKPAKGNPRRTPSRRIAVDQAVDSANALASIYVRADAYDVITIADMRATGDRPLRIAHEVRIQAANGYRSGLIHVPTKAVHAEHVRSEIDACLLRGEASLVVHKDRVQARLVVVHGGESLFDPIPDAFPAIETARLIVVIDRTLSQPALHHAHRMLSIVFRTTPVWAPTTPAIRDALLKAWEEVPIEVDNWSPALAASPYRPRTFRADRPVVAVAFADAKGGPSGDDRQFVEDLGRINYVRAIRTDIHDEKTISATSEWFSPAEIAITKVLSRSDFLVIADPVSETLPRMLVAEAMAGGTVPILPSAIQKEIGPGCVAGDKGKINEIVAKAWDDDRLGELARDAARAARNVWPDAIHLSRLERLTGKAPVAARAAAAPRRIAFVSSNGVGLGHITRLLSIARRLPADVEPVFFTMSQAFGLLEAFGYLAEYIPFHTQSEHSTNADWNDWFRVQFEQLMDYYAVSAVVFDGGAPYAGLIGAVANRADVPAVWVRRGMWRAQQFNEPLIRRQKFFDLIIEPRDIAGSKDEGMTAVHRGRVAHVDPIRLLDEQDLLTRAAAAAELGLDPDRPAVLVQLGSGTTRDVVTITREVIEACQAHPELQIVLIEWSIGVASFDRWPGIRVMKGFPTSRYFNAFDFTVAAAGYNSYNEIISFGLPAIFVANDAPMMDDQGGRAVFAEEQGAALSVSENRIAHDLPGILAAVLDPRTREVMRVNCLRIALDNGAAEAAALIAGVLPDGGTAAAPPAERRALVPA
ncbi:MAG: glycosyltransferase [Bauldia sp.]